MNGPLPQSYRRILYFVVPLQTITTCFSRLENHHREHKLRVSSTILTPRAKTFSKLFHLNIPKRSTRQYSIFFKKKYHDNLSFQNIKKAFESGASQRRHGEKCTFTDEEDICQLNGKWQYNHPYDNRIITKEGKPCCHIYYKKRLDHPPKSRLSINRKRMFGPDQVDDKLEAMEMKRQKRECSVNCFSAHKY